MAELETLVGARPGPEISPPAPPEQPKVEEPPVIQGEVVLKKRFGRAIAEKFNVADPAQVGDSIMKYYIMPTIAKLICDVVANSIYMFIFKQFPNGASPYQFGGVQSQPWFGGAPVRNAGTPIGYQDFTQFSKPMQQQAVPPSMQRPLNYSDIILPSADKAKALQMQMVREASLNMKCTVASMFKFVDQVAPYTYNSYGWFVNDIQSAPILPSGNGWMIKLPTPQYILNN